MILRPGPSVIQAGRPWLLYKAPVLRDGGSPLPKVSTVTIPDYCRSRWGATNSVNTLPTPVRETSSSSPPVRSSAVQCKWRPTRYV